MGYEPIIKNGQSIIKHGVEKAKYIAPTCRVGTAKQLGISIGGFSKGLVTNLFEPSVKINLTQKVQEIEAIRKTYYATLMNKFENNLLDKAFITM